MKYSKLRGKIVEVFGTMARFSDAIGISPQLLSMKLSGKTDFTYRQIISVAAALNIPTNKIVEYFF